MHVRDTESHETLLRALAFARGRTGSGTSALMIGRLRVTYGEFAARLDALEAGLRTTGLGVAGAGQARVDGPGRRRCATVLTGPGAASLLYPIAIWRTGATVLLLDPLDTSTWRLPGDFMTEAALRSSHLVAFEAPSPLSVADAVLEAHPGLRVIVPSATAKPPFMRRVLGRLARRTDAMFPARTSVTNGASRGRVLGEAEMIAAAHRMATRNKASAATSGRARVLEPAVLCAGSRGRLDALGHSNLATAVRQLQVVLADDLSADTRILTCVPPASPMALIVALAVWQSGATLVLPDLGGAPQDGLRHQPGIVIASAAVVTRWVLEGRVPGGGLDRCKVILCPDGAPGDAVLAGLRTITNARLMAGWLVAPGVLAAVATLQGAGPLKPELVEPGLVPLDGTIIQATDLAGTPDEVPRGDRGILRVVGPQLSELFSDTGDVGLVSRSNRVLVVDRREDLIECAGYLIYPGRVEAVLTSHPSVAAAAVVAARTGGRHSRAVALVELKPPGTVDPRRADRGAEAATGRGAVTAGDLTGFLAGRLSRIEQPSEVVITQALVRDAWGRVSRAAARAALGDQSG